MNLRDTLKNVARDALIGLDDLVDRNQKDAHERICLIAHDCAAYLAHYKSEDEIYARSWLDAYGSVCPDGYDTVIGWLSKHRPELVEMMQDPTRDTMTDGRLLAKACKDRGIEPAKVDAPLIFVKEGFHVINAYPVDMLKERFGG